MTRRTHRPAAPTSKYQAAVLAREGLSDWYDRPGPELLDYFSSWHRLANQTRGAASMPNDVTVAQMVRDQKLRTDMTEFFYLTTDVARLIQDASQTMPPHLLIDSDFPSTHGFIHLETPLSFSLVDDQIPMMIRAIVWSREHVGQGEQDSGPGCVTWEYVSTPQIRRHPDTESWPDAIFRTPLFPVAYGSIRDGRLPWICWDVDASPESAVRVAMDQPSVFAEFTNFQNAPSQSEDYVPIPPGSTVLKPGTEDGHWIVRVPEGNTIHYEPDHVGRFLQTFFLFLRQELPSLHRETRDMPKPMLQRFRFKGINRSPISIITWRRREHTPYNSDTGRSISYRYVRRGHWRYNNFRHIDGVRTRWPVFIAPVLVGDPSLPFRERTVVNKVSR
jgi:hypothetical protein